LIAFTFEAVTNYIFPALTSDIFDEIDMLQRVQDPPYSNGIMMIEVHRGLCRRKWSLYILRRIIETSITELTRSDYLYIEENFYKMSLVKIDGYMLYSEWISKRYPGYLLDKNTNLIVSTTDHRVHLDEFFALMRSTDIARYEKEKDKFFGPSGRFTTRNAIE